MTTLLGRVRRLGSAKSRTAEDSVKQFTGLLLALLTPYVVVLIIMMAGQPYSYVAEAMKSLWVAPPFTAFMLVSFQSVFRDLHQVGSPNRVFTSINTMFFTVQKRPPALIPSAIM